MSKVKLTMALSDYDHVRDLASGEITPEGIDLICLTLPVEEIFHRFSSYREWDISEFSFALYSSMKSRDDDSLTAIPVFPSRVFRHSAVYVRADGGMKRFEDLLGKKVGVPEWAQTAGVWVRGFMTHEKINLAEINWVQAGLNQPGRIEHVEMRLPPGVRITRIADRSLDEMLVAGEIDAVISARGPATFERGDARLRRLFEDFQPLEEEYSRTTGVFPIMHVIAIQQKVLSQYPWVAMSLFKAFEAAKRRSIERAFDITASRFPLAWGGAAARKTRQLFSGDYWPYGVEPNRVTLEAFLQYSFEQGVSLRRLKVEEIFAQETLSVFRV
jgi:4,5-dihydroxyphthalate decarboxylase